MLGEDTVPYDAEEAAWQGWQARGFGDGSKLSFVFHTKLGWVEYGIVMYSFLNANDIAVNDVPDEKDDDHQNNHRHDNDNDNQYVSKRDNDYTLYYILLLLLFIIIIIIIILITTMRTIIAQNSDMQ